jgi:hypothetical protein
MTSPAPLPSAPRPWPPSRDPLALSGGLGTRLALALALLVALWAAVAWAMAA